MKRDLLLTFYVKDMKDNLGPEGLLPSLIFFREYNKSLTGSEPVEPQPNLFSHVTVANYVRTEMDAIFETMRLQRALQHQERNYAMKNYSLGHEVLVCRENSI